MQVIPSDTGWNLVPYDRTITRLLLDAAVTLESVFGEHQWQIRIAQPFVVARDNRDYPCVPEAWATLTPLHDLFLQEIAMIRIFHAGELLLHLHPSGMTLQVAPHPKYEAWDISGTQFRGVTCMPGGAVAFWKPQVSR